MILLYFRFVKELFPDSMNIQLQNHQVLLDHRKAIYWPDSKTLMIADVHIGKASHFRKNGIAIPTIANQNNLWIMSQLIEAYQAQELIILGDLSHDKANDEWEQFIDFRQMYPKMSWILISGNHDRLSSEDYKKAQIKQFERLEWREFDLIHDPADVLDNDRYHLCGHVHPAIRLRGAGRQSLKLDCFYFGEKLGILPAFGEFTGRFVIDASSEDRLFVIGNKEVIPISPEALAH